MKDGHCRQEGSSTKATGQKAAPPARAQRAPAPKTSGKKVSHAVTKVLKAPFDREENLTTYNLH
jgi:hypothetical protein